MTMTRMTNWKGESLPFSTALYDRPPADTRPADARALANGPWRVPKNMAEGWRKHFAVGYDGLQKEYESAIAPAEQPTTPCAAIIRDALGHAAQIVEQITSAEDEEQASVAKREAHYCPRCHAAGAHMPNCQMQQAHAMSHPSANGCENAVEALSTDFALLERMRAAASMSGGRQHVSDGAWEAWGAEYGRPSDSERRAIERLNKERNTVLLTVAEHDELLAKANRCEKAMSDEAPKAGLSRALRERAERAVGRVRSINFASAAPDDAVVTHLCEIVERIEKIGDMAQLDRENARLRRELAAMRIERDNWAAEAQRYAGNADYWRERAEGKPADNVTRIEPFPDPKPRSESWPPPSHKPRMLP